MPPLGGLDASGTLGAWLDGEVPIHIDDPLALADDDVDERPLLRGWSHAGFLGVAAVAGLALIIAAPSTGSRIAVSIYAFGITAMLTISSLYHRIRWSKQNKARMLKFDHTGIFLCVAGTYTPIAAIGFRDWVGHTVLAVVWGATAVGLFVEWWPNARHRYFAHTAFLVIGWVAVLAAPFLWIDLGWVGFIGVTLGGVLYTVGAVIHATKRPDPFPTVFGFHEIFHAFVIAALVVHYLTIAFVVLPMA